MQVPISWFYLIRCNTQYLLLSCIMLYNLMGYFLKSLVKNITMYTESKTLNGLTLPILSSISKSYKKNIVIMVL